MSSALNTIHVVLDGNVQGPFSREQILEMVGQGQLLGETPAWKEGLADWKRLDQLVSLPAPIPAAHGRMNRATEAIPRLDSGQPLQTPGCFLVLLALIAWLIIRYALPAASSDTYPGITVRVLGWVAFGYTVLGCWHFGTAAVSSDKPLLYRESYLKTALVLALQCLWALCDANFNKLHLCWMFWPSIRLVSTLVGNWRFYFIMQPMGLPTAVPLPPLTTAVLLQLVVLWLVS